MNNVEILEDYIEALRKPKPFKYTNEQKAQTIENLIQENKELKELESLTKESIKNSNFIKKNYIPKSKIREKIEELEKEYNQFVEWDREDDCFITREIIEILEELLEGDK